MEVSRKIHAPATLSPGNQPTYRVVILHGLLNRSGRLGEQNDPWPAKSRNPQLVARHLPTLTNLSSSAHSVLWAFRDTKTRPCSSKHPGLYGTHAQSNFIITNTNTTNTGGKQIPSLRFAKICIQIFRASNKQPSRTYQASSKSPHPRRPVPSVLNVTWDPSILSSDGFTSQGLQAQSPARGTLRLQRHRTKVA